MARRKRKLTPAEQFRIVNDPALTRYWPENQIAAENRRLRKLRTRLYGRLAVPPADDSGREVGGHVKGQCCSHRWAEDVWEEGTTYPPRADTPTQKMRPCRRCQADVPAHTLTSSGHCQDCRYETMPMGELMHLQGSASVIDAHNLRGHRERSR